MGKIAEAKTALRTELAGLLRKPPEEVCNGSVQLVRRWVATHKKAKASFCSRRSSVRILQLAIDRMKDIDAMRCEDDCQPD